MRVSLRRSLAEALGGGMDVEQCAALLDDHCDESHCSLDFDGFCRVVDDALSGGAGKSLRRSPPHRTT